MMNILGIDLGEKTFRALQVINNFGKLKWEKAFEIELSEHPSPHHALESLLQSIHAGEDDFQSPIDRIVLTLPSHQMTFRNLRFPTRNRKIIESSIAFELEDDLPFPIEEIKYDYTIVKKSKEATLLHIAATLKRNIEKRLQFFQEAQLTPDALTSEVWALSCLVQKLYAKIGLRGEVIENAPSTLIVFCSEHRCFFFLYSEGKAEIFYEIPRFQLATIPLAETFFIKELQKMSLWSEKLTYLQPQQVFLMGDAWENLQLEAQFHAAVEKSLKIPVQVFNPDNFKQVLQLSPELEHALPDKKVEPYLMAFAIALTQISTDKSLTINFQSKTSAKRDLIDLTELPVLKSGFLILCGCLIYSFISNLYVSKTYEQELKKTKSVVEKAITAFHRQANPKTLQTYLDQPQTFQKSIDQELKIQKEILVKLGSQKISPLQWITQLSEMIPSSLTLDLIQWTMGPQVFHSRFGVKMTFLVNTPEAALELEKFLAKVMLPLEKKQPERITLALEPPIEKLQVTFLGIPIEGGFDE